MTSDKTTGRCPITYEEAHSIEVEHAVRHRLPIPTYQETVERMQKLEREGRDYTLPDRAFPRLRTSRSIASRTTAAR